METEKQVAHPTPRAWIARRLIAVWRGGLARYYLNNQIGNEGNLVALFFAELRPLLEGTSWEAYVTPTIEITTRDEESKKIIRPDLILCRKEGNVLQVTCVMEFKYAPRGTPDATKDLNALRLIAGMPHGEMRRGRYVGEVGTRAIPFSERMLLVWAGIQSDDREECQHPPASLSPKLPRSSSHHFLGMRALANRNVLRTVIELPKGMRPAPADCSEVTSAAWETVERLKRKRSVVDEVATLGSAS